MAINGIINRFLRRVFINAFRAEFTQLRYELRHDMLASIGLEELEKVVQQGKKNRKTKGHSDYTNLTQMFIEITNKRKNG